MLLTFAFSNLVLIPEWVPQEVFTLVYTRPIVNSVIQVTWTCPGRCESGSRVVVNVNYYLGPMNELEKKSTELVQLEERAEEFLKEPLDVHTAMAEKPTKVRNLIKQRPSSICRLPVEILLAIFKHNIYEQPSLRRKGELAAVSHQWKDIITNSPTIWSFINLSDLHESEMRTHLWRSKNALLDIVIGFDLWLEDPEGSAEEFDEEPGKDSWHKDSALSLRLDTITPHANRWQSLCIIDQRNPDMATETLGKVISKLLKDFKFPFLKCVIIPDFGYTSYPTFLSSTRAPALEYLELEDYSLTNSFAPVTTLKTLHLVLKVDYMHRVNFRSLIPTHALTTLRLEGHISNWIFRPNSIQFPVLVVLDLKVSNVNQFLDAIVTPNLEFFGYDSPFGEKDPPQVLFGGLGPKFSSVRRIRICSTNRLFREVRNSTLLRLECQTFPGVRHVELAPNVFVDICMARLQSANSTQGPYPMDSWKHLESVSVQVSPLSAMWPSDQWAGVRDHLLEWLAQRRKFDAPLLRVKVVGVPDRSTEYNLKYLICLYDSLKMCCKVEFDVPVRVRAHLAVDADSSLLVSITGVSKMKRELSCPHRSIWDYRSMNPIEEGAMACV